MKLEAGQLPILGHLRYRPVLFLEEFLKDHRTSLRHDHQRRSRPRTAIGLMMR